MKCFVTLLSIPDIIINDKLKSLRITENHRDFTIIPELDSESNLFIMLVLSQISKLHEPLSDRHYYYIPCINIVTAIRFHQLLYALHRLLSPLEIKNNVARHVFYESNHLEK